VSGRLLMLRTYVPWPFQFASPVSQPGPRPHCQIPAMNRSVRVIKGLFPYTLKLKLHSKVALSNYQTGNDQ
jgi:hypothetical protein